MDRVAQAHAEERVDLFRRSAGVLRPERSPAIVEKDFWVCWALHRLFETRQPHPQLIFKGGTCLSKAYALIERFSEDVDLSLSRRDLGFVAHRDPEEPGVSGKESRRRIEALVIACQEVVVTRMLPDMRDDFASVIGTDGWSLDPDPTDAQTLIFSYPATELAALLPLAIRPSIRLEFGARSDDWPVEYREIQPFAAQALPIAFTIGPSCRVRALDATRTFWEKATLLHAEYHRPEDKTPAAGVSRHYYDLCQLARQRIGRQALARLDLLTRVVAHKRLFFASAWAHYETATPGTFHLVPTNEQAATLRADYARMHEMLFGAAPRWEEIVAGLRELEAEINKSL